MRKIQYNSPVVLTFAIASAACLLLGPVITLHSACIYGTILLIFNLTMFLIFITLLLLVALGFIAI